MFLAARGARATDQGTVPIEDPQLAAVLKGRAGRIHLYSLLTATVYTLVLVVASLLIPWRLSIDV